MGENTLEAWEVAAKRATEMLNASKKDVSEDARQQCLEEAIGCFRTASELRPDYARVYVGLCRALSLRGQSASARTILMQGLESCPQDRVLLRELQKIEETLVLSQSQPQESTNETWAGAIEETSFSVQPLQGPGQGLTPEGLSKRWASLTWRHDVVSFKGTEEREKMTWVRCFSNFYNEHPFVFELPPELCAPGFKLSEKDRNVKCDFSEKAIMLCKAAVMGDFDIYQKVAAAETPNEAKQLGRRIPDLDAALWNHVVCSVAFEVVWQKFHKIRPLQAVLLETRDSLITEATRADNVWGIGIDKGDTRIYRPSEWKGANVLGWALMEVRASLQRDM